MLQKYQVHFNYLLKSRKLNLMHQLIFISDQYTLIEHSVILKEHKRKIHNKFHIHWKLQFSSPIFLAKHTGNLYKQSEVLMLTWTAWRWL